MLTVASCNCKEGTRTNSSCNNALKWAERYDSNSRRHRGHVFEFCLKRAEARPCLYGRAALLFCEAPLELRSVNSPRYANAYSRQRPHHVLAMRMVGERGGITRVEKRCA